ncbi:response regulator transcription factor [Pantoea sp. ICBG 1758]|uniref:response regulator transcription factor n=1 Tax=Pantoea sp. ICBG 1758 TaxID=2071682 RepID=UPI0021016A9B|nr:response regulator transcription factor [Pantoea sp. ICBG 1758]
MDLNTQPVRIAVLDGHPMIRLVFELCLKNHPDIHLVAAWSSGSELFSALSTHSVDVLILDFLLGEREIDGLTLIKQIRNHYPMQKMLVLTSAESPAVARMVLRAGVNGFIGKSHPFEEVLAAVRSVAENNLFLATHLAEEIQTLYAISGKKADDDFCISCKPVLHEKIRLLSPREAEVIRCFLDGMSVSQIAAKFRRSRKTVSGQKQSTLKKLGVRSDSELFKYSRELLSAR